MLTKQRLIYLFLLSTLALIGCANPTDTTSMENENNVKLIGRYASMQYGVSAAEIVKYHAESQRAYIVNAQSSQIDIIDLGNLAAQATADNLNPFTLNNLPKIGSIDMRHNLNIDGIGGVNSIDIYDNLLAVAIERSDMNGNLKQGKGFISFYRLNDEVTLPIFITSIEVGYLPDNIVFNQDGSLLLVANEGEPNDTYTVDPEGSISVIKITNGQPNPPVINLTFSNFNRKENRHNEITKEIKINGPNASVAQDLEPEYIAVSKDNQKAFVTLQENNAVAIIDLNALSIDKIVALGGKDFGQPNHGIDASDKDNKINIQPYPGVFGLYQPDTIASYEAKGRQYFVTANEGDSRDYSGFSEESRVGKVTLDPQHKQFLSAQDKAILGRLKVTTSMGDTDSDGDYDKLYSFGARSFTIWSSDGELVFDSGNDFETITAKTLGINFNTNNSKNKPDSRSDDKGPEPEALSIGAIGNQTFAFIGLERTSGFMIYNITTPADSKFVKYINNRSFDTDFKITGDNVVKGNINHAGDLGPEGMTFISADNSPTNQPLLLIANEVSGSTSVYQFKNDFK